MTRAERILYDKLVALLEQHGDGNVPRETLDELYNIYPTHLWEGLRDKGFLTKESDMVYIHLI